MRDIERNETYNEVMKLDEFLWCPKCGITENIKATVSINSNVSFDKDNFQTGFTSMYLNTKYHKCEDSFMVLLESEIFDAVIKLNDKDYKTSYSCEGHYFNEPAYISFLEPYGSKLAIGNPPTGWYFEDMIMHVDDSEISTIILRPLYSLIREKYYKIKGIGFDEVKAESIENLNKWVDNLKSFYYPLIK